MKFSARTSKLEDKQDAFCVVGAFQSKQLKGFAARVDKLTQGALSRRVRAGDFQAKEGEITVLFEPPGLDCKQLVVVGYGSEEGFNIKRLRRVCAAVAQKSRDMNAKVATLWLLADELSGSSVEDRARHLVESVEEALYRFDQMKSKPERQPDIRFNLSVTTKAQLKAARSGIKQGSAIAAGVALARTLANLPGNVCTPSYLAQQARRLQKKYPIKTRILTESDMKKLGMGALLSVSRGSRQPAKLIIMEYHGGPKSKRPVALVGKGLTFDAGGISLKPAAKMDEMKFDMCGAASVYGALVAAAEMKLPINVVGVVPSSENLPDGAANKPGDIVTSMSGTTVEVLNTDAEGRLILCDALTYSERFKPQAVIDIATLTGACVVALGNHASGLMTNDQTLADEVLAAGQKSLDRAWQLPLWDEYQKQLDSNFADLANIGGPAAGAITAACFLSRFTKSFKWVHLDIAGTAWHSGNKIKGATGRVVPLLSQFLIGRSGNPS